MKNQITNIAVILLATGLVLSCGMFSGKGNSAVGTSANKPGVNCPTQSISVTEAKGGITQWENCELSVEGKIWEIKSDVISLIEITDRTDLNGAFVVSGTFTDSRFGTIGQRIEGDKLSQSYDKLPIVTFTGIVETNGGSAKLTHCHLTDSRKS